MRDRVYSTEQSHIVDFAFTEEVARVFPDMIRRSVPGYETVIPMTGLIAARHLSDEGIAYDLGCSLGATTQALLACNPAAGVRVVGVDSSSAMIEGAIAANTDPRASFVHADIRNVSVDGAHAVLLNFVLQFIDPADRLDLLKRLKQTLRPGGMLLLSEKLRHADPAVHDFYDQTHLAWKRANGYSELEVSQKRTALENVMRVDTAQTHLDRLGEAGFHDTVEWYRCMNWASFIAYA